MTYRKQRLDSRNLTTITLKVAIQLSRMSKNLTVGRVGDEAAKAATLKYLNFYLLARNLLGTLRRHGQAKH